MGHRTRYSGAVVTAGYVLLVALPVVLAFAGDPFPGSLLVRLGRAAGLIGFAMLALEVVLTSRVRFIERAFGLDRLTRFHKLAALVACVLILAHPTLLGVGRYPFDAAPGWQIELGEIALAILVLGVLFALTFKALGMSYQLWRFLHKGMIAVVVLGFVHALVIGADLYRTGMRVYFWTLLVAAGLVFLYRNVFVPLWGRRRFRVASVTQETHDTFTLALEPEDGKALPHYPGQFMFLTLRRAEMRSEEHPFTIASAPTREGPVTVTVKQSGDFTNTIGRTRPGDLALVEAPFGRFSFVDHDAKRFLFIAGGVGITPLMSMLRSLADTDDERPAVLLFANKTEADILFRDELSQPPENVEVVHVLSQPDDGWTGATGYVTAEVIEELAGMMLDDAEVFLCGPPAMMNGVVRALKTLGVARRRIHTERFAL